MTDVPSQTQNPGGFHRRYAITKLNGDTVDPRAIYFVLRLDGHGRDEVHIAACRAAVRTYSSYVQSSFVPGQHLRQLGYELLNMIDHMERLDGIGVPTAPDDKVGGYLTVGLSTDGSQVVLNLDHDRTGHIVFSSNQARQLANLLHSKSNEAFCNGGYQVERDATAGIDKTDPMLPPGIEYGGRGPGGEHYSMEINPLISVILWTEGEDSWTADELEAIAHHKRCVDSRYGSNQKES